MRDVAALRHRNHDAFQPQPTYNQKGNSYNNFNKLIGELYLFQGSEPLCVMIHPAARIREILLGSVPSGITCPTPSSWLFQDAQQGNVGSAAARRLVTDLRLVATLIAFARSSKILRLCEE